MKPNYTQGRIFQNACSKNSQPMWEYKTLHRFKRVGLAYSSHRHSSPPVPGKCSWNMRWIYCSCSVREKLPCLVYTQTFTPNEEFHDCPGSKITRVSAQSELLFSFRTNWLAFQLTLVASLYLQWNLPVSSLVTATLLAYSLAPIERCFLGIKKPSRRINLCLSKLRLSR